MKVSEEISMATSTHPLPTAQWYLRHRKELWLLVGGLAVLGLLLACAILVVNSHPTLQSPMNRCRMIFVTGWCIFAWTIICFRKSLDDWIRRHKKRFWVCLSGLAVYEAFFGAWAWHFAHSPHPVYPDPRAVCIVVAIIGITVLFFILWPLFCIRFRTNRP